LASCGIPRSGIDLRIMGDDGVELARGEVGEICVKGPSVMKGYWEQKEATAAALRDGWLRTGDLAYMDDHRFVYILDRNKDMIITGGSNVYPREVEEILMQHPDVLEACVIGIPDDLWGEVVMALVVLKEGAIVAEQDLIAFAATRLASYKKPRSVTVVKELPKNTYGKVLKRHLRDQYRQLLRSHQRGSALSQ
jgi:long-chain acyl-CoA synthetase